MKYFVDELHSKGPKKNYATNKTSFYHIDDIWNLDILYLKDYSPENNRGYRYVFSNHRLFLKIWLENNQ